VKGISSGNQYASEMDMFFLYVWAMSGAEADI